AIMVEHRHLALGVDRDEPVRVLLELVQVDIDAFVLEALLLERDHRLERVRQRLGMVVLERHRQTSMLSSTPPSTAQSCPVTWLAASESRNAAPSAISIGVPMRRCGTRAAILPFCSSGIRSSASVAMKPGMMQLARTLCGAISTAIARVSPSTPCFDAT